MGEATGRTRSLALLLTVATGFSGLVYEVTWEKLLATLLGSHSAATAAVLGIFLGGLALGYAGFGRFTRRRLQRALERGEPPRLLSAYGLVEVAIGVYAWLFPWIFGAVQILSTAIPYGGGGVGFAVDVALAALAIGPPAALMGGTIPILTQALARDLDDATRIHSSVYGCNTVGAFAGALAAGFWIVPSLGLDGTLIAMGAVNAAAGTAFLALGRTPAAGAALATAGAKASRMPRGFSQLAAAALLLGFGMMTIQTGLIRLGALSFGASQFTFSIVVAAFVLCIALGSLAVSALPRVPRWALAADLWAVVALTLVLYRVAPDATYWAHRLRVEFPLDPAAFLPYHLSAFAAVLAVIGLPIALSGAALPLIFDHLRRDVGDLGDRAGRLYAFNTAGSLLGALLGGYALLFWLDLHQTFRAAALALALAAALGTRVTTRRGGVAAVALAAAAVTAALLPAWPPERLSVGAFRYRTPVDGTFAGPDDFILRNTDRDHLFHDDDPLISVDVVRTRLPDGGFDLDILNNGKSDGGVVLDYPTMALTALLPALLAKRAESAFVIGYGTGTTVAILAALEDTRSITVAEFSQGVRRASAFFEEHHGGALRFPGLRIVTSDAYRALMRSDERYDLIVSEPSNPWVLGVEMLYSREFLEAARARLRPGGVHLQWFHAYETDSRTVEMVLSAYAAVFEHMSVWYVGQDLLLVGQLSPDPGENLERITERMARTDFAAALDRMGIDRPIALLGHELLPSGSVNALGLPPANHTLMHPRLNDAAARAFFVGGSGTLPRISGASAARIAEANSLLGRYIRDRDGRLPGRDRYALVQGACADRKDLCATLLAWWLHEEPHSPRLHQLRRRIRARPGDRPVDDPLDRIESLAALYGGRGTPRPRASSADLRQLLTDFSVHYHPGVPFSADALSAVLASCPLAETARCEELRAEAAAWTDPVSSSAVRRSPRASESR